MVNGKVDVTWEDVYDTTLAIVEHSLNHWEAFSEAAKQVNITPAEALARALTIALCHDDLKIPTP